jgi:flagellar hook protein FlgE
MLRSMFTAISALNAHQAWMDVLGNNLANVNTQGYKSSHIAFMDQVSQLMRSGAAPSTALGGVDPMQVGLGMRLGSINVNFAQGALQSTGRSSDLALQGDGFFLYSTTLRDTGTSTAGSAPVTGTRYYSRDGSIDMDASGYLVNTNNGMRLLGWQPIFTSASAGGYVDTGMQLTGLQIPINSTLARQTANGTIRGNLDSQMPTTIPYTVTMGIYDSLGQPHTVTVAFTHLTANPPAVPVNTWGWSATYLNTAGSAAAGSGTITFSTSGSVMASTNASGSSALGTGLLSVNFGANSGAASPQTIAVDFNGMTQLSTDNSAYMSLQDGLAAGALTGFNFESNTGRVIAVYSNGLQKWVGQVAVGNFANPPGLVKAGQNLFLEGLNSGAPSIGIPDTGGRGVIVPSYVEASNVDLAQEFTNMILAQRGFQASSRMITTSDEMLQELVNLKR